MKSCIVLMIFAALFGTGLSLRCYECINEQCNNESIPLVTCPLEYENPFCLFYGGMKTATSARAVGTFCFEASLDTNSSTPCEYFKEQNKNDLNVQICHSCQYDLCMQRAPRPNRMSNENFHEMDRRVSMASSCPKEFPGVVLIQAGIIFAIFN